MYAIIPLVLLILFIITFIIVGLFTKAFIDKKTLLYTIPLLLITWHLYSVGYLYSKGFFDMTSAMECLVCSLKAFAFDTKREFYQALGETNTLYLVDIYMATILSGLTLVSSVLGFFKVGLVNFFKLMHHLRKRNPDIVYGYNDDAFAYCKNCLKENRSAVLWIDSDKKKLTNDEKKRLFLSNITYIYNDFDARHIARYTRLSHGNVHIVCFQKNNENMANIYSVLQELKITRRILYTFHVQSSSAYLSFVNDQLNEKILDKKHVAANAFDYYELISRLFSANYNLARFLPRDFIKYGQILPNKTISVVMLGFGKTSSAVLQSLLINNQFVTTKNNKLTCKKVQYYIYDKAQDALKKSILGLFKYEKRSAKLNKDYFPHYELPGDIHIENKDINTEMPDELLNKIRGNKDEYVFYVVGMPNNLDTLAVAKQISLHANKKLATIFYNIDSTSEIMKGSDNCYPYGYKNEILTHDVLANDELCRFAAKTDDVYRELKNDTKMTNFNELPVDEKLSNIYGDINIRFKLNMLGFDYGDKSKTGVSKKEFMKAYDSKWNGKEYDYKNYNDYFKINTRMSMAYQEHLRWVIFYVLAGYRPLPKSKFGFDNKKDKIIHKFPESKVHACLTSFEGLDEFHHHLVNSYAKHHIKKTISDVETYKYDAMYLDRIIFNVLTKSGYPIYPLKKAGE